MKLKSDFFGDWIESLKDVLIVEWGCDISLVPDSEIPLLYFNTKSKRPVRKARKLVLSDVFISMQQLMVCTQELKDGWELLRKRIESGEDLTMNLSKRAYKPKNKDGMLNEWGVHHFHLNERKGGGFIHGTKELLFAWLVDDVFYAIGVFDHDSWVDEDIIEIMSRNWPNELAKYKVQGNVSPTHLTEQQRKALRQAGVNTMVTTKNGGSYFAIGGGLAGSGFNMQAVKSINSQKTMLKNLEIQVAEQLEHLQGVLEERGYKEGMKVEASLNIRGDDYIVTFPKYMFSIVFSETNTLYHQ